MLRRLIIRNVILIDQLELLFSPGLTVFTGETGAGKSILLDALGLAMGCRADGALIRQGCGEAVVIAELDVPTDSWFTDVLKERDLKEGESLLLRRHIFREGPSRAYINDQPVSVSLLRDFADRLIDIHGQFDRWTQPAAHRAALDAYAHVSLKSVQKTYQVWKDAEKVCQDYQQMIQTSQQERAFRQFQGEDLRTLKPLMGEETQLLDERLRLMQSERIREGLTVIIQVLQAALNHIYQVEKALTRMTDLLSTAIPSMIDTTARGISEIQDLLGQSETHLATLQTHEERLDVVDERLAYLRSMARKYAVSVESLPDLWQRCEVACASDEDQASETARLETILRDAKATYQQEALQLHHQREQAATAFSRDIAQELPALKLSDARVNIQVESLSDAQWSEAGWDRVDIQVAMNPGQTLTPLGKTASGGELARFMLALKVVLTRDEKLSTFVFDEIDMGVSGAVAAAIGDRLKRLSRATQTLAITHSPQVAAYADAHFKIQKIGGLDGVTTDARLLTSEEQKEELARLLSGDCVQDEARAAAERLLKDLRIDHETTHHRKAS